jgi:hypothetical protein
VKDPQTIAEELAKRRANNAEAARRCRKRKDMKMKSLAKQAADLTNENNELKSQINELEIENKSLEEINLEKRKRIKVLKRQFKLIKEV